MTNVLEDIKEIELYRAANRIIDGDVSEEDKKFRENNITFFCEYSLPVKFTNIGMETYIIKQVNDKIHMYRVEKDQEIFKTSSLDYIISGIGIGIGIGLFASKYLKRFWK